MENLEELLEQAAARYGSRGAVCYKVGERDLIWSYDELAGHVRRVAGWMAAQGIGKGDRVVLWGPNSPWWVAAYFGALRLGAILVPLDVRSSNDFVARAVGQTEPRLALLSAATRPAWTYPAPVTLMEDLDHVPAADAPRAAVQASDIAELMFTSGTTGDPKGVIMTHGNIMSNVRAVDPLVPHNPHHRVISILPLSHMLEQTIGMLVPLQQGATIYYLGTFQPPLLFRVMKDFQPTTILLVPQALQLFMASIEREVEKQGKEGTWHRLQQMAQHLPQAGRRLLFRSVHARLGGKVEFMMSGGAPLAPELIHKWELMGIPVLQGYGTTETAPVITLTPADDHAPGSVGKVLAGVQVRIAEDGEILVQGPNVTPGYWHNPEATAAAFADGWYKTGDLGQLDAAGHMHLQGRKKDLIVLASGQNVYPQDVEQALIAVPGIIDAAVVGLPSGDGVDVHAVLLRESPEVDAAAAVSEANKHLAPHQRIRGWTVWAGEDFPRTHTQKVKKHEILRVLQGTTPAPAPAGVGTPA